MKLGKILGIGLGTVITLVLLAVFVVQLKNAQDQDLTKLLGIDQNLSAKIDPNITLVDEEGKDVKFGSLLGERPIVLMMIFYRCQSACLTEMESALKTFRSIKTQTVGQDYDVVAVSIHPKETPDLAAAKKREYVDLYNRPKTSYVGTTIGSARGAGDAGWHFLTGKEEEVKKLANQVGFKYSYDVEKDRVIHPTGLILITPTGRVSKYFLGTDYPAKYFADSLLAAKDNQVGEVAEFVSVGCFTVDPSTGRTFVTVQDAIRLTGTITVLALAFGIISMLRKEKSASKDKQELPNHEEQV
jgi:protein SCO1/2